MGEVRGGVAYGSPAHQAAQFLQTGRTGAGRVFPGVPWQGWWSSVVASVASDM